MRFAFIDVEKAMYPLPHTLPRFEWRDPDPSGAEFIEWYHRWVESGDIVSKQRILDYNEDDCRATRVLLRMSAPASTDL